MLNLNHTMKTFLGSCLFSLGYLNLAIATPAGMSAASGPKQKTLRIRTFGDPLTFDWNRAFTPIESNFVRNLQEGLVAIEPVKKGNQTSVKIAPSLAEKWAISPDGRTYTFNLRKNVKWSDGLPLKAADFVASWKRLLSPGFKANTAYLLFDIENAEDFHQGKISDFGVVGVKALDERTLQVKLRAPIAYWIWIPTFWSTFPIRQDIVDKFGNGQWDKPGSMVNLGPFLLASYDKGRNVVLKRNPNYYGKRGNIDEINAALVEDDATAVKLYESGQLDFVSRIASGDLARFKDRPDLVRWPEARVVHLNFNPNQAPTSSLSLRKAIAMAIDRKKLSKAVENIYQPASTLVTPNIMGYEKSYGLPFDPKAAQAALGTMNKEQLSLDLVAVASTDEALTAQFIQKELQTNLGINVKLHLYEPKQFYSPTVNFSGFTMLLNRWTADYPDPDNFFSVFLGSAGNNRVGWKNAAYDEIVIKARSVSNLKAREKLYAEAQKILIEEQVIALPMFYGQNGALVRPTISGFRPSPTNAHLFKEFSLRD